MKKLLTILIGMSLCSFAFAKELTEILNPNVYAIIAAGDSSEDPEELAVGAHDPNDNFVVQGIELNTSVRLNEYVEGYVNLLLAYGADEEWEEEVEEAFGKLTKLPGDTEIRGGRFLNRFGLLNAKHQHSWNFVDVPLVSGRFLGDEGLVSEGADITWYLPTDWTSAITVSYGEALSHDHGHGDEEEEAEIDEAGFEDDFITVNAFTKFNYNDFHQYRVGGSYATGDNGLGDETDIFGVNFAYIWRENGLEPGGKSFTWNTEVFSRHINEGEGGHGHEDEHGHEEEEHHDDEEGEHHDDEGEEHGDFEELGFYTEMIYGFDERLDIGLRFGHVEGIAELGGEERSRVSPSIRYKLLEDRPVYLRLQYNYDDLEEDEAHSFWAQIQAGFGKGGEVR